MDTSKKPDECRFCEYYIIKEPPVMVI